LATVTSPAGYDRTARQNEAIYEYATFLLLKENNRSYFSNTIVAADSKETDWFTEFEIPTGNPIANATELSNGLWLRKFDNLLAIVNPTDSILNFTPVNTFYEIGGDKISTVSIPARSGKIYLNKPCIITKKALPNYIETNSATYELTIKNHTNQNIKNLIVSDKLLSGYNLIEATNGYQLIDSKINWNLADLSPLSSSTYKFKIGK
jgi:hypothetical protein